ncbi:hypothetical protein QTP88_026023 [Uroleucon formosanum]
MASSSSEEDAQYVPSPIKKQKMGKAINEKVRIRIVNMYKTIIMNEPSISVRQIRKQISETLGVGERSIQIIITTYKETNTVTAPKQTRKKKSFRDVFDEFSKNAVRRHTHTVPVPKRTRNKKSFRDLFDDFAKNAVRRHVHNIWFRREIPTVDKIYQAVSVDDRNIKKYREEGRHIYFLDETWVNAGDCTSKTWVDTTVRSHRDAFLKGLKSTGVVNPSGKGKRLIVLHIGSEDGFLPGGLLCFESKKNTSDYHNEMNGDTFREWMEGILPLLQPNSEVMLNVKKILSDKEKVSILQNVWTPDLKFNFPYDNSGKYKRKIQIKWLETFKWLAYSKLREGLLCKFCVLFLNLNQAGKGSHEKLGKLVLKPLTKLKDVLEDFRYHEKNYYHKNLLLIADKIKAILEKKQDNILVRLNSKRKDEVIKNRAKLKPIIQTIRLCSRQQIALRGHEDSGRISLEEPKNNDEHLETSGGKSMYTSPLIQNEIIHLFGDLIQLKILERVSKTNFYTILADETTDISQIEQFSLCIHFLTFVPVYDLSGEGLANTIKETLKKIGFDLNKMRGQGYDGAASMGGRFRGVQAIIKNMYPKALYTHCVSHSLNLCLSDATKSQDIRNAFGIISECCSFFNSSAKRTTVLQNKIKEIKPNSQSTKLKSLCETRWVLRHEAVMLFKKFLEPVVAALEEVKLLSYTYNLSKYLQSKNIYLFNALNQVSDVISVIVVEKPFSYLKKAVEFYENDLPGLNDVIEAEYEIWHAKWKNIEDNLKPTIAIEALSVCDNLMYPNILTGLALLAIHRDIDIPDDILLDKFANSGKERNLNLI